MNAVGNWITRQLQVAMGGDCEQCLESHNDEELYWAWVGGFEEMAQSHSGCDIVVREQMLPTYVKRSQGQDD